MGGAHARWVSESELERESVPAPRGTGPESLSHYMIYD